jgi:hypothetical protein
MEFQKLLLLFSYFALSTVLSAQQAEVLLVHGKIEYIVAGQQQWTTVQLPFTASKGQFRLTTGSIMLYKISGTEKTVQLKKPGTYSIPALVTHANEDGGSLTRAIGSQLVKSSNGTKTSKGSVSRGSGSERMPFDSAYAAAGAAITFRNDLVPASAYRFRIENEEGEELIDSLITKAELRYTPPGPGTYNWRIDVKGSESGQNITTLIVEGAEVFAERKSSYDALLAELTDVPEEWKSQLLELYFSEHPRLVFE